MTHAEELKNSGLKATLPRLKVLEVFQKSSQRHMSAEDVYKHLLAEGADVGLATVYRVEFRFPMLRKARELMRRTRAVFTIPPAGYPFAERSALQIGGWPADAATAP